MVRVQNEKRRMPRIVLNAPLRYQVRGEPGFDNTVCSNVSQRGVGFISNKFIAPNKVLMLEFRVLSRAMYPIGRVAWTSSLQGTDSYKIGIEFLELSGEERAYLSDYLDLKNKEF